MTEDETTLTLTLLAPVRVEVTVSERPNRGLRVVDPHGAELACGPGDLRERIFQQRDAREALFDALRGDHD